MWTTCKSGSKDDCDIIFLYCGNLIFDKVEEVDGGEQEKEDEWVLTQEDYDCEKDDEALEREGIEGEEFEQDVEVEGVEEEKTDEITGKDKEIKSKDEEVKKMENPDGVEKKDHGGAQPKTVTTVQVPFNT